MKLLIKEYLRSLKERGELDAILPDLLSEMGLHVFSRPAVGVRQNGVDLAAVGVDRDGQRKVFLFSVKAGDLTRNDWNGTLQSLRPSLDEIIDSYIPNRIPNEYSDLPIAICICLGGDIDQNVDTDLRNYVNRNTSGTLEFQEWDGDRLANYLLSAILSEQLLPQNARSNFRKSIAMLDEPDAAYQYFSDMILQLHDNLGSRQKDLISFLRQLNLCAWILFAWSREAENLEAPYRCSELAVLWCWKLTSQHLTKKTKQATAMAQAMTNILRLHIEIANRLCQEKYFPNVDVRHGLSHAVNSRYSLDVNLKVFELIGRVALTGIWLQFFMKRNQGLAEAERQQLNSEIEDYANKIIQIVNSNDILITPISDSQTTDIGLVCMFLSMRRRYDVIYDWVNQIMMGAIFATNANSKYPCVYHEYAQLASHPNAKNDEEYFKDATAGSTLYPTLAVWLKACDDNVDLSHLSSFLTETLPHCTLQLWSPSENSEAHFYTNSGQHGYAVVGLEISKTGQELTEVIREECKASKNLFENLSAIKLYHWPIVLTACRHHRSPIPINFFGDLFSDAEESSETT